MEESENQLVDNLDDSEESADNMIIVSSSEDQKADEDDDEALLLEDEDAALGETLGEEVNDAKENDDNVAAESDVVDTAVEKETSKPVKKTKKKEKGKWFLDALWLLF